MSGGKRHFVIGGRLSQGDSPQLGSNKGISLKAFKFNFNKEDRNSSTVLTLLATMSFGEIGIDAKI